MSRKKSTKKSGLLEPVYALVGVTELAANALRELGADKEREEEAQAAAKATPIARLRGDVTDIARGTTKVPGLAAEELRARYTELAQRGQQTVSGVVPVVKKTRSDVESAARSEEARARREARRLARQAGATVTRGRAFAGQAAGDATKAAERTFEAVRTEAGQVVDSVTRPGRIKSRRDAAARRRMAVTDTAVTAISPIGGDPSTKTELAGSGGVEAASASIGRRSPRARKNVTIDDERPASRSSVTRRAAGTSSPEPTTVVAKKARARAASEAEESTVVWTSETSPTPEHAADATPEQHENPTPVDVAEQVEAHRDDA